MVRTTGLEWKRFYSDPEFWPEGWWHEEEEITIDGVVYGDSADIDLSKVSDTAAMTIAYGAVFKGEYNEKAPSLEVHFKAWRKKQTTVILSVEVDKEKLDAVKSAIKAAGGKATG